MPRLEGTVALVTGGTSGIGLSVTRRFLEEGARVAFTGRERDRGEAVERSFGDRDRARFIAADVADEIAVGESVQVTLEALGRLDVLVNNAGVALTESLLETPVAEFDRLMAINVRGCFLYARASFAALAEAGGSLVHIASDAGLRGEQAIGAYSVSKAAVVMMSKVLALDGAEHGIRSNCICPGATTPGMRHIGPAGDPDRGDDSSTAPARPARRAEDGAARSRPVPGHDFCRWDQNWKMHAPIFVRDSDEHYREIHPRLAHPECEWMELCEADADAQSAPGAS